MSDVDRIVLIDYTNWRGERKKYHIIPGEMVFNKNEWHQEYQWLLEAEVVGKGYVRQFAMKDVHSWEPCHS